MPICVKFEVNVMKLDRRRCFCCFFNLLFFEMYWWNPISKVWIDDRISSDFLQRYSILIALNMNHTGALGFHILFVLLWVIALLDVFNKANLSKIDIFIKYHNCYSCQIINTNIWITKTCMLPNDLVNEIRQKKMFLLFL
jgi:hypothetical protein